MKDNVKSEKIVRLHLIDDGKIRKSLDMFPDSQCTTVLRTRHVTQERDLKGLLDLPGNLSLIFLST